MKKVLAFSTAILLVSMGVVLLTGTVTVQAETSEVLVTSFTDWKSDSDGTGIPVTLTPSIGVPAKVTVEANGSSGETWGGLLTAGPVEDAIGMKATINISKVSAATAQVQIGIMGSLGMIINKQDSQKSQRIQASIFYEANNYTQSRIRWKIKSKTSSTSTVLATGTFGDLWSSGYNINKNITIYFKRVNNGIVFGIDKTPYTSTWTSTKKMSDYDPSPELFGYAYLGNNSIKGVIKDVKLLYWTELDGAAIP